MFRWRHPVSAIRGVKSALTERHTKGRDAARTVSRPLAHVCICRMCAPGVLSQGVVSGCCLRVLSQRLALQVCDRLISAHVLISHELLDAVGVHVHVFLAAQGTDLGANTVSNFTLNAVAQV